MRMQYWDSKFANMSPFPLPKEMPKDAFILAKMAIEQITSVDKSTKISVYDTQVDVEESEDKTWIVSGMSGRQKELLHHWPRRSTLQVEGAFKVWLRNTQVTYFVLRGKVTPRRPKFSQFDDYDLKKISVWTHGQVAEAEAYLPEPTVHEQDDGTILACCATGTSSKDSLLSWIRLLEKEIPNMNHLQVLFTIKQAWSPLKPLSKEELILKPAAK